MEWIILETLVVLALALAIVWWTLAPSRRRRERDRAAPEDDRHGPDQ